MSLRIGIYASAMASDRGHEKNISAHIQVPVETARRFAAAGHDVHLITNSFSDAYVLPTALPKNATVHLIDDGRRRPKVRRGGGNKKGYRPLGLVKQLSQLRALTGELDVMHLFGLSRTAVLGGVVAALRPHCPIVATLVAGNLRENPGAFTRGRLRALDAIVSSTDFAADQIRELGLPVDLVRHGVIRDLVAELDQQVADGTVAPVDTTRRRVLFWRDPNAANGADLCVEVFDRVAPDFPEWTFDLAIRPTRIEVPGVDELASEHANVNVYRFPYSDGISLPRLIGESALVLLPFRLLTVDPQLAIAESLDAGVPVIASDVRSNPELIEPGATGQIVPSGDATAIEEALRTLLRDPDRLAAMGQTTRETFRSRWNWETYQDDLLAIYRRVGAG